MKRLHTNHYTKLTKHTLQNQLTRKKPHIGALLTLVLGSSMFLSACTSDKDGQVRVIDLSNKNSTQTTDITLNSTLSLTGATLSVYDMSNNKSLLTAPFNGSNSTSVTVNSSNLPKNATLLVRLGKSNTQTSSYYDASLDSNTSIPANKPLLSFSSTNNSGTIGSVNPTPYSTLAVYRALAKIGWFFEHSSLPTDTEFATLLENEPSLIQHYNTALRELRATFSITNDNLSQLTQFSDLVTLAENNTNLNISTDVYNWVITLANMKIYTDNFTTSAPYFTFAHDLAKDFYDGDIDGATYPGLGNNLATSTKNQLVSNGMVLANIANDDPNLNTKNGHYEKQRDILNDYETKLNNKLTSISTMIVANSSSANQTMLRTQFDNLIARFATNDVSESPADRQLSTYNPQTAKLTYADFNATNLPHKLFQGVGNKTFAFGLQDQEQSKQNINLDDNLLLSLNGDDLIGKYAGNNCNLTINANGVVTLTVNGTKYTTFIDRELNDSIHRIGSSPTQDYMLNVSRFNDNANQRRYIQIHVINQKPLTASTSITQMADGTPLNNPDASCTFN